MSWRMRITHRSGYRYAGEVAVSYNEARLTPLTSATQTTLHWRLDITPAAATYTYTDYWGTQVTVFEVLVPHDELIVVASSVVETSPEQVEGRDLRWSDLTDPAVRDRMVEMLAPTPRTEVDPELAELAKKAAALPTPTQAAEFIAGHVLGEMRYVHGVTGVHTSAVEAWGERVGVCQDLAHVTIALMREAGIPARYVSGYLHPVPTAEVGQSVQGESHAWVEWWDGAWVPCDPTNGEPVAHRHIVVARGRDYADVTPLKGVYSGPHSTGLGVVVDMARLA